MIYQDTVLTCILAGVIWIATHPLKITKRVVVNVERKYPQPSPPIKVLPKPVPPPNRVGVWQGDHLFHVTTVGSKEHAEFLQDPSFQVLPLGQVPSKADGDLNGR